MLLALTPNPALDRTLLIPNVQLGQVHRAQQVLVAAGGKGLNVARVARSLRQTVQVAGPLGGMTGQQLARLAAEEGFAAHWVWYTPGETRTCVLVVDPHANDATALNEPGMALSSHDWQRFVDMVLTAAMQATLVTISGSLPPGIEPHHLAQLITELKVRGRQTLVDTSDAALQATLDAAPYGLKVNGSELAQALGCPVATVAQAARVLQTLRARGIELAAVSLGDLGAVAATSAGICHAQPPQLQILSSVGSGDALTAGLAVGLLRQLAIDEALVLGVACGSANALRLGSGVLAQEELEPIRQQTRLEWLAY